MVAIALAGALVACGADPTATPNPFPAGAPDRHVIGDGEAAVTMLVFDDYQ